MCGKLNIYFYLQKEEVTQRITEPIQIKIDFKSNKFCNVLPENENIIHCASFTSQKENIIMGEAYYQKHTILTSLTL